MLIYCAGMLIGRGTVDLCSWRRWFRIILEIFYGACVVRWAVAQNLFHIFQVHKDSQTVIKLQLASRIISGKFYLNLAIDQKRGPMTSPKPPIGLFWIVEYEILRQPEIEQKKQQRSKP